jgi:hypothetical protein
LMVDGSTTARSVHQPSTINHQPVTSPNARP